MTEHPNSIKWTDDEIERLREAWYDITVTLDDMGEVIGRAVTRSSVVQKAERIGLPKRRVALGHNARASSPTYGGAWTPEDDSILKELWFNANYAVIHIAAKLPNPRGECAVSRRAKKLGLPNRSLLFIGEQPRARRSKPPPRQRAAPRQKTCKFPLSLVPPRRACGEPTTGNFCQFHTELMGG